MPENYIGQFTLFAGAHPPLGWAFCNGQNLNTMNAIALSLVTGFPLSSDNESVQLPNIPPPADHLNYMICVNGIFPVQGDPNNTSFPFERDSNKEIVDGYIAEIRLFAISESGGLLPQHWAHCNGASLSITENLALYFLIGNQFGGDTENFKLPTLPPPANYMSYCICIQGTFPQTGQ